MIAATMFERARATSEALKDAKAFCAKNPGATKAQVRAAMKAKWVAKYGADTDWFKLLMEVILPLILKLLGL